MPGYRGIVLWGTAGSTAGTQITRAEDLNYDTAAEKTETTTRGDGTAPPIVTEETVARKPTITFSLIHKDGDATQIALLAAARVGDVLVAMRTKSHSTGTGYDGDMSLSVTHELTLKGQSKYNFTGTASDRNRAPLLNA